MTNKKRIGAGQLGDMLALGEQLVRRRAIVADFPVPGTGLTIRLAYTPHHEYQREVAELERAALAELPAVVEACEGLSTHEEKTRVEAEVIRRLDDHEKGIAHESAVVAVVASRVVAIWNPAISTPDDPAVLLKDLIALGAPFAPDVPLDAECVVTPEAVAFVVGASSVFRGFIGLKLHYLGGFYAREQERLEGNSEPSQSGTGPEAGPATTVDPPASANSPAGSSAGSPKKTGSGSSKRRGKAG
jgi:hypothetical protein